MSKGISLTDEVFQKLGAYLMSRPMGEVRALVQEIEASAKVVDLPDEAPVTVEE